MAGTILHSVQVSAHPNNPAYDVSKDAWNGNHVVTPYTIAEVLSDHVKAAHDWQKVGTFTIDAYTSSKAVTHGLAGTPKVLLQNKSNFANLKVINEGATTFTAVIEAPQDTATEVNYYASL